MRGEKGRQTGMLDAVAFVVSLCALGLAGVTFRRATVNGDTQKALVAAREENQKICQTLADVIDSDGNVRGQLALPGHIPTFEAMVQLREAEEREREAAKLLKRAHKKVEGVIQSHDQISRHLAEVVDKDGKVLVQLRLPGERVKINVTPCGLCVHVFQRQKDPSTDDIETYCAVGEGRTTESARKRLGFLNASKNCVHFQQRESGTVIRP